MRRPDRQSLFSRRSFLECSTAVVAAAGSLGVRDVHGESWGRSRPAKVIDCHAHLHHHTQAAWADQDRALIEAADKLGIDQLCCSTLTPRRPSTAAGFRECNGGTGEGMKRFPGRVLGYCYVNPGYQREALDEVRRRIGEGFIGIKLYNEFRCTDPVVFPVVELAIKLGVPILHHAGHMHYPVPDQPRISDGGYLSQLAARYPEAKLICAHISGGGDWEWTIKAMRHAPSVYLDLSGSVIDDGIIEMAAQVLGVDRLLFGCDMSMTAAVGRMRAAELDPGDKDKIMGGNMLRILERGKS